MKKCTAVLLSAVILAGCGSSKTYFSSNIRQSVEKSGNSLQQIQYYIDRDITLRREMEIGETRVEGGTVQVENGKQIVTLRLKKNTPGVCVLTKPGQIGVAFETGNKRFLLFERPREASWADPYRLVSEFVSGKPYVMYEGKRYEVVNNGAQAAVQITKTEEKKIIRTERNMAGRKVSR